MRVPFLSSKCLIQWARTSQNKPQSTSFNRTVSTEVVVQCTGAPAEETHSPNDSFSHGLWRSVRKGQRGKGNLSSSPNYMYALTWILAGKQNTRAETELLFLAFLSGNSSKATAAFLLKSIEQLRYLFCLFKKFSSKHAFDCWDLTSLALGS